MKHTLLALLLTCCAWALHANGIAVTNVALGDQDLASQTATISFDLSWDNSWRVNEGPLNYDAAWVFGKYRIGTGPWQHLTVDRINRNATGSIARVRETGIIISRQTSGTGDLDLTGIQFDWAYGADGVGDDDVVEVKLFAVEMVYVPTGDFLAGLPPGGSPAEVAAFFQHASSGPDLAYPITSSSEFSAITVGTATSNLDYAAAGGDRAGPIPEEFPVGYSAFYAMKYEVSQQQWVDFFNTLTAAQQSANDITDAGGKNSDAVVARNGVSWSGTGEATTSLPELPVSYVSEAQMLAYLDWAALRPLSELEFERAARGSLEADAGEYAWLDPSLATAAYTLTNAGASNEQVANPEASGNAAYATTTSGLGGPVRVGAFAASAPSPTREATGGSFYGFMELSGNLAERVVTVGTVAGRGFAVSDPATNQPLFGSDGELTAGGEHDVPGWSTLTATAFGTRGGGYDGAAARLLLADRAAAASGAPASDATGFRGAISFF